MDGTARHYVIIVDNTMLIGFKSTEAKGLPNSLVVKPSNGKPKVTGFDSPSAHF